MWKKIKPPIKFVGAIVIELIIVTILTKLGFTDKIISLLGDNSAGLYKFFNYYTFNLLDVIIFFLLTVITFAVLIKLFYRKKYIKTDEDKIYELKEKFKEDYKFMSIPDNDGVIFKVDIQFSGNNIFINAINVYCLKHDKRVRMMIEKEFYNCPIHLCDNGFINVPTIMENVKHQILSELEYKWERWIRSKV